MTQPTTQQPATRSQGGILRGRVGRFPVWLLGLILAGVFVIFVLIRNRASKNASQTVGDLTGGTGGYVDPTISDTSSYGLPPGPIGSYLSNDPTNAAYPVGLTPQGIPGPVTNQQWGRLVADQLIAKGDDPTLVSNALYKYLSGASLNASESSVINLAQQMLGQPPEGVIPIQIVTGTNSGSGTGSTSGSGTPAPTSTPTPVVTTRRSVLVARYTNTAPPWNSTLSGIAAHYGTTVERLQQINHIANRNLIYTGQRIYIDPK